MGVDKQDLSRISEVADSPRVADRVARWTSHGGDIRQGVPSHAEEATAQVYAMQRIAVEMACVTRIDFTVRQGIQCGPTSL